MNLHSGKKRVICGTVISTKMKDTATIIVERTVRHPLYGKVIKKKKKYKVHDKGNKCKVGDKISAIECRPISKTKHFRLLKILESGSSI